MVDTHVSIYTNPVAVSATSWAIYNLGVVTLPLRDRRAVLTSLFAASYDGTNYLVVCAKDNGSTTYLYCDCIVLIPTEYYIYVNYAGVTFSHDCFVCTSPVDESVAVDVNQTTNAIDNVCASFVYGTGIPVGDSRAFVCTVRDSGVAPPYNDDIDVTLSTYNRWLSLRGIE